MSLSLAFAINSALLSADSAQSEFTSLGSKVGFFIIVVLGAVLLRPLALKGMYRMLYEPYGRVEDYRVEDTNMMNGDDHKKARKDSSSRVVFDFSEQPHS
jgi:hypothetical protein